MAKKQLMALNILGWHIVTDTPMVTPWGIQIGVKALCNGGIFADHPRAKRVRPTCQFCKKIWEKTK